ncbi:MAG: hypothetical protein ABIE07_03105 [Candidatus Zixiibacteriota bacterium]
MRTIDSLDGVERRAYRSTFSDGVYDIAFGAVFILLALIPVLEAAGISKYYGYLLLILPALMIIVAKRVITIPRMGAVEFGPKRKTKKRLILIIAAVVVFLMMPVAIMVLPKFASGYHMWTVISLAGAPLVALSIYFLDHPRFILYCALFFFGILMAEFMLPYIGNPLNYVMALGLPGIVIDVYGLALFTAFIRKYPKVNSEVSHVAG